MCGLKLGPKSGMLIRRKKSKSGQTRSQSSTMLEGWDVFISSIRKTKGTKKPSKTQGESWKFQWRRQCHGSEEWWIQQDSTCIVKAPESTRQRLESHLPKDHEDHIAGKGYNSMAHCTLVHKFIRCLKRWKCLMRKQQWTRNGRSLKRFQPDSWTKLRAKRRLLWKHKETNIKSTLLQWCSCVISKNADLEPKFQKCTGRIVLRGDNGDSGAFAVFT